MPGPLICVGHSHIVAISKGASLANRSIMEFRLREIGKAKKASRKEESNLIGEKLGAAIREHQTKHVFSFCGGGTPAVLGLVQHPQRFDFVLPDNDALPFDSAAMPLPFTAVRATMAARLRKHWRVLRQILELKPARLIQVESPPPTMAEDFMTRAAAKYDPDVRDFGVSSPYLRYKFWKLHSNLFEEFCMKSGIVYFKNPPEIFDESGFLSEPYWGDYVHANAQYGAVILQHLEELEQ